jgi:hypothetical protein
MYLTLNRVKIGQQFELCRTGEVYTLIAARPETPSGYRRDCQDSSGRITNLHHNCKVMLLTENQ